MKTIFTTLPVYDSLAKQGYRRGNGDERGLKAPVPIPRHTFPSMLWNVEADNPGELNSIKLVEYYTGSETEIFATTSTDDCYFNKSLILNSTFTNVDYNTFNSADGIIISIIKTVAAGVNYGRSNTISVTSGDRIYISGVNVLTSGTAPKCVVIDAGGGAISNVITLTGGGAVFRNILYVTATDAAARIKIYNENTELVNCVVGVAFYKTSMPYINSALTDKYFSYDSYPLQTLLPFGTYYLKMVSNNGYIYYSEVFEVVCIYPNLFSGWTNYNFDTFTTSGTTITSAIDAGITAYTTSTQTFNVKKGDVITVIFNYTLNAGSATTVRLYLGALVASNYVNAVNGLNIITLTAILTGSMILLFDNAGATTNYSTTEVICFRSYSEDYLTINFHNDCDLGEIIYQDGLTQTLWIKGDNIETTFPMTPEGSEDGNGRFIPTFRRQEKLYLIRTPFVTLAMVDCLHRLPLHDSIELIDLFGDTWTVQNMEVEHEWQGDDKNFALVTLTVDLGEAVVIAGCCNNIL